MALRRKPLVGIIHSTESKSTITGGELAIYLGVCLQLGGFSDVRIIGFSDNDGTATKKAGSKATGMPPHGKYSVVPYGGSKPTHPNHAECCRDGWEALEKCNMILICVDPKDTVACCKRLSSTAKMGSDMAIVGFDLGVRNHTALETQLGSHDAIVLSGAVGISVAKSPVDGHLRCMGRGSLVVERLTKKQSKKGVKFLNLLRSGGIPLRYCKNVSSYTHGAIIFNTVYAGAALAGVPLREFLRDRNGRLLWAAMVREGLKVITLAARGGGWREANPCCCLTLPQLELMLCLPTPLFSVVSRLVLLFPPGLAPAMQRDLAGGRETRVASTLGEIIKIADVHNAATPACRAVLSAVKRAVMRADGVPCTPPQSLLLAAFGSRGSDSSQALNHKLMVWCCSLAVGAVVLGCIWGVWAAVIGVVIMLFSAVVKYALVGDVVP